MPATAFISVRCISICQASLPPPMRALPAAVQTIKYHHASRKTKRNTQRTKATYCVTNTSKTLDQPPATGFTSA